MGGRGVRDIRIGGRGKGVRGKGVRGRGEWDRVEGGEG